jgi:hypothetical protein
MDDKIHFLRSHHPALTAGEYEVKVEQKVSLESGSDPKLPETFSKAWTFSVRGERLTLKPVDVAAVFPPAGSLGDHADVLPHIQLNRSTLPWERSAVPKSSEGLWLVLLLFHDAEAPAPKIVRVKDLSNGEAAFPPLVNKSELNDDDPVTVIDVPKNLLEAIMPAMDELAILTHVRQARKFIITDQAIDFLRADRVPDSVLEKLASIKGQQFDESAAFQDSVKSALGKNTPEPIAAAAATMIETAVVIGKRLPRPQGVSTAHLVSVEGRYDKSSFDYQRAGANDLIRLVSLHSWSFTCADSQQNLIGLLRGLDRSPSTLRLPHKKGSPEEPYLAQGALPLWHAMRRGDRVVSWYHGPLAPTANPLTETDPSAPELPARAADELMRYNPTTGMFDVSYAAAWELGRLLALQNKTFSVSLYNWKRAHTQSLRQAEDQLLHASPLDDEPDAKSIRLPREVSDWFRRLSLLEGAPFKYLVPDERLLPLESIRFFQLDWLWIECLLDGAFSIGRVIAADHRRDGAHSERPAANPHSKVSGFLMRSEAVSGWPGLLVDGLNGEKKLNLLRMDRLSANVMICLFDDLVTAVDIHLRPEMSHFEVEPDKKRENIYKKLRGHNPDKKAIGPIQLPKNGVINILKLAKAINENSSPITSEQFALQMIVTSPKVRFSLSP